MALVWRWCGVCAGVDCTCVLGLWRGLFMFSCDPVFRALLRRGHAVVATDFNETGLHTAAKEDDWEGLAHSHSASDSLEAP